MDHPRPVAVGIARTASTQSKKTNRVVFVSIAAVLFAGLMASDRTAGADSTPAAAAPALSTPIVAPDLAGELAKFKRVRMPFAATALSGRGHRMVAKLVEPCRYLDRIYWQQSDPAGWQLYRQLPGEQSVGAGNLRRFLRIYGSRCDLIREKTS